MIDFSTALGNRPLSLSGSALTSGLTATGTGNNDTISGSAFDDVLRGGAGVDSLDGSLGNDTYIVDSSSDSIADSGGKDTLVTSVSYQLAQGIEIEFMRAGLATDVDDINLTGNAFNQRMTGNVGSNLLDGGSGNDLLFGEAGDDQLIGGVGSDQLTGGSGSDIFVFTEAFESLPGAAERDSVADFQSGLDKISLQAIDADAVLEGDQAFSFIGNSQFSGSSGQLRYANGILSADVNGDAVSDFQLALTNAATLMEFDILL